MGISSLASTVKAGPRQQLLGLSDCVLVEMQRIDWPMVSDGQ